MTPEIYWVRDVEPHRLALMARPRSGDWLRDEVSGWRRAGIATAVSLLESHEVRELGLGEEARLCEECGIAFIAFPIPDRGTPSSMSATAQLVQSLLTELRQGKAIAVHCRAGIGRTGLLAACVLLGLGISVREVFAVLGRARMLTVPDTSEQAQWVARYHREVQTAV